MCKTPKDFEKLCKNKDVRYVLGWWNENNVEKAINLCETPEDFENLCKNKDAIDNFNKKALYIMIREMTDVKTSKITQVSNVFRKIYPKIQQEILKKGHIENLNLTGSL